MLLISFVHIFAYTGESECDTVECHLKININPCLILTTSKGQIQAFIIEAVIAFSLRDLLEGKHLSSFMLSCVHMMSWCKLRWWIFDVATVVIMEDVFYAWFLLLPKWSQNKKVYQHKDKIVEVSSLHGEGEVPRKSYKRFMAKAWIWHFICYVKISKELISVFGMSEFMCRHSNFILHSIVLNFASWLCTIWKL